MKGRRIKQSWPNIDTFGHKSNHRLSKLSAHRSSHLINPPSSPRRTAAASSSTVFRSARTRGSCSAAKARCRAHPVCLARCCAVDDKEIDTAKMQVQGQLAAQYIQDVMQVRPEPPPQRRSPWSTRAICVPAPALHAATGSETGRPHSPVARPPADPRDLLLVALRRK
jgi:hypothetical protein